MSKQHILPTLQNLPLGDKFISYINYIGIMFTYPDHNESLVEAGLRHHVEQGKGTGNSLRERDGGMRDALSPQSGQHRESRKPSSSTPYECWITNQK